jgi:uncharacterized delta-60 repeat protein
LGDQREKRAGIGRRAAGRALGAAALALALFCAPAVAAPGDLDPSFSTDGKVISCCITPDLAPLVAPDFSDAARAPNGTIVVSGESGLRRLKADGTMSRVFAGEGDPTQLAAIAVQPDGKIVAVGDYDYYAPEHGDFAVLRYNPDGSPDDNFGTDGRVLTDFGGRWDRATSVAIQPDGKIVVAGYSAESDTASAPATDFAVARYDPNGTLDLSFSGDGKQTTGFGGTDEAEGIAIQPNGKLVVGGSAGGDLAAARYLPDGAPDASFSGDGKTRAGLAGSHGLGGQAVALQPNGRIIVAGGPNGEVALARFSTDGSLDRSFSGDGTVTAPLPTSPYFPGSAAYDVIVRGDRIVAAGSAAGNFALTQYRLNGALDRSFSGDGMLTTEFGTPRTDFNTDDWASAIVPEGNAVVLAGTSIYYAPKSYDSYLQAALARYLISDGPPDADADGVVDSLDQCPDVFASRAADGCPFYGRGLDVEVRNHSGKVLLRFWGTSLPACLDRARVKVYKLRRGDRRQIRVGELRTAGHGYDRQLYETWVRKTRGRVYAQIDENVVPAYGRCGPARSDPVPLRRSR